MTLPDNDATEWEAQRFLDNEGLIPGVDEAFEDLVEQSIIDEGELMPDIQALKESTVQPGETFEQWLERVSGESEAS